LRQRLNELLGLLLVCSLESVEVLLASQLKLGDLLALLDEHYYVELVYPF
jgi:hypothetical protein